MHLSRFRLRTLMIAVAVAALLIVAGLMVERSRDFARHAVIHGEAEEQRRHVLKVWTENIGDRVKEEREALKDARDHGRISREMDAEVLDYYVKQAMDLIDANEATGTYTNDDPTGLRRVAEARRSAAKDRKDLPEIELQIQYHARLRRKYERAARYPWLRVSSDPPEPGLHNELDLPMAIGPCYPVR